MHAPLRIAPARLAAIALGSVIILLIAFYRPQPRPEIAPAGAGIPAWPMPVAEGGVAPGAATPTPQPLSDSFAQVSPELHVYSDDGLFTPEDEARLGAELERALAYVSQRFGSGPSGRVDAYVGWEPGCGLHGIAYTTERSTHVFTCPSLPRARAVNIMAHEFVHQLAQDRYGDAHLSTDLILLEGVATWGAGAYWLGDAPSFGAFVRPWVEQGSALPLGISYVGRPIGDMNTLYYQWGSFVEFLIQTYGREAFDRLYVTGDYEPGSADYAGVYGKGLDQLEQEWRAWALTQ